MNGFYRILPAIGALTCIYGAAEAFCPEHHAVFTPGPGGRYVASRGIAQQLLGELRPACAFDPGMEASGFPAWQSRLRAALEKLMKFPRRTGVRPPRLVAAERRKGYRLERWEAYPFPHAVAPFLVLVPDGVTRHNPAPVIFCLPGSGQTKEELAGEPPGGSAGECTGPGKSAMAYHYVQEGWIAVAVDNAGSGEQGDLERAAGRNSYDDADLARVLLEMDWSWLGYTSYVDQCILDWVKKLPAADAQYLVLSGFSLGTEPMMVLGVLNPDIDAFVYNDFLCRTLERARTMTMPDARGRREAPNSIRHLVPGFWKQFDFPDLVAALAPRPVICTEGGLDRDFELIAAAYRLAGAPGNCTLLHQPRFADPATRRQGNGSLPAGLDRQAFFRLANVDPSNHFFKKEAVIPWLRRLLPHSPARDASPQETR